MKYVAVRLVQLVVVLLIVSFLAFLMIRVLPGDPVLAMPGCHADRTENEPAARERDAGQEELRARQPVIQAYLGWLGDILRPTSTSATPTSATRRSRSCSARRCPARSLLMFYSVIVSLVLAIPLGVLAAHRQGGWTDKLISSSAFGVIAFPNFVVAVVLVYVFAIELGWLPATGVVDFPRIRPSTSRATSSRRDAGGRAEARGLHAAPAHRPDLDAAGGLHQDGQGQGHARRGGSCCATPSGRRASRSSRSSASTSAG